MDLSRKEAPSSLTEEEKRRDLYLRQKHMLERFLRHGALSPAQYRKSLGDLTEKMGMEAVRAADDAADGTGGE